MKIRNGFVSNSSSSSFTMIVDKELHDKVMEVLTHSYFKKVLSSISYEFNAFGKNLIETSYTNGNYSTFEYDRIEPDDENNLPENWNEWNGYYGCPEEGVCNEYFDTIKKLDPDKKGHHSINVDF